LRFSIANLLTAIAIIAVGLAALNSPSRLTVGLVTIVTLGVLLAAVVGAIYRTGEARAFWLGSAVFGWSYFLIAFSPAFPTAKAAIDPPLLALRDTFWTVKIPDGDTSPSLVGMDTAYDAAIRTTLARPSWHHYFGVTIHCIVTLLFALVGGIVGRWFCASSGRRASSAAV
jgi:hypothetical protein